jgi:hypothetical protein
LLNSREVISTFSVLVINTSSSEVVDLIHIFGDTVEFSHIDEGGLVSFEGLVDLLGQQALAGQTEFIKVNVIG